MQVTNSQYVAQRSGLEDHGAGTEDSADCFPKKQAVYVFLWPAHELHARSSSLKEIWQRAIDLILAQEAEKAWCHRGVIVMNPMKGHRVSKCAKSVSMVSGPCPDPFCQADMLLLRVIEHMRLGCG